jgi:hypothetical protein
MTWRDHLRIGLWITAPLFAGGFFVIGAAKSQWTQSIDDRLAKWQQAYHLSNETVEKFRLIELQFHGSGNPFTSPIHRSPQEVQIHHQQMAEIIGEPQGRLFLNIRRASQSIAGSLILPSIYWQQIAHDCEL